MMRKRKFQRCRFTFCPVFNVDWWKMNINWKQIYRSIWYSFSNCIVLIFSLTLKIAKNKILEIFFWNYLEELVIFTVKWYSFEKRGEIFENFNIIKYFHVFYIPRANEEWTNKKIKLRVSSRHIISFNWRRMCNENNKTTRETRQTIGT